MKAWRAEMLAAGIGVVLAIVLMTTVAPSSTNPAGASYIPWIGSVLWMHTPTPTSSGTERWYNFTLTVNQTIPLADLLFGLRNQSGLILQPPTFMLALMNRTLSIAQYNLSGVWTSGSSGAMVSGDWLAIQVANQNLTADKLVAFGQGQFAGLCGVAIP